MKIGLMSANSGDFTRPEPFIALAKGAEQFGFESIWTVEHVAVPLGYRSQYPYSADGELPGGDADYPRSDPFIPLAFAAGITQRIRLGTAIAILPLHHPLYVAKQVATIDRLSGGRMILGVGGGWMKEEFDALGIDFSTRGGRTDEAIRAIRALWRENPSTFRGRFYDFGPLASFPKPIDKDGAPIHIGGHSMPAIRRAAILGDGFFPAIGDPAKLRELFAALRRECEKIGRNQDSIELSCWARAKLEMIKRAADMGVSRVVLSPPAGSADEITVWLERVANDVAIRV